MNADATDLKLKASRVLDNLLSSRRLMDEARLNVEEALLLLKGFQTSQPRITDSIVRVGTVSDMLVLETQTLMDAYSDIDIWRSDL